MTSASSIGVTYLTWDSNFFKFPVGQLVLPIGNVDPQRVKIAVREADSELTYVFLPVGGDVSRDTEGPRSALVDLGGKCCDLKITYRKSLADEPDARVKPASVADAVSPKLEELAYASGWCSRFVADERLQPFFKPMYLLWLKRDLKQGKVFVLPSKEAPEGMATVSIQGGIGKVGLVAVDAKSCGKGIATQLMRNTDAWFSEQGVRECEVVTQGMNIAARRLYEKIGYKVMSQMEVWHVWKREET